MSESETTPGPDPRLLEELDEHIRGARAAAEEALGDSEHTFVKSDDAEQEDDPGGGTQSDEEAVDDAEHTFVESGDDQSEQEDDQTIAPG